MQLILNYGIPVVLVLIGAQSGSAYGHRIMGSFLGLLAAIIYLLVVMRGDIYMIRGSKAIKAGDTKKGIMLYEKALNHNTKTEYMLYACYCFLRFGYPEKCISHLEKTVSKKPLTNAQKAEAATTKGLYLWKNGDLSAAEDEFRKAHSLAMSSSTYSQLGFILLEEKKYDEALALNLEAKEYNDSDPSISDNLAMSYFYNGETDKALELYDEIMKNGTRFPVIYYNHALVLEKVGRLSEAAEALDTALHYKFSYLAAVSREEVEKKAEYINSIR